MQAIEQPARFGARSSARRDSGKWTSPETREALDTVWFMAPRLPPFALLLLLLLLSPPLHAFPPAPHHVLYGLVRDQYGSPLRSSTVSVVLETPNGTRLATPVSPGLAAGVNYQLKVPMDAGLSLDLLKPNSLFRAAPFKLYVVIGGVTNVPIEMSGQFASLGRPGRQTKVNLTLGVDANRDGIPDAWEAAFLAALGSDLSVADLHAGLDLFGDGRTLRDEFLLGASPENPSSQFAVRLVGFVEDAALLEFPTATGRSYTILGSSDLEQWSVVPFRIPAEGAAGLAHTFYWAPNARGVQVQVLQPPGVTPFQFYRVLAQ